MQGIAELLEQHPAGTALGELAEQNSGKGRLVVGRSGIDPVDNGLDLGFRELGPSQRHLAADNQVDEVAAIRVAGYHHRTIVGASQHVGLACEMQSYLSLS
jgi:hypothetical protein